MPEILCVGAHPDDLDVMQGFSIARDSDRVLAFVTTRGESGVNLRDKDPSFVSEGRRVHEAEAGLASLGVPAERQIYPDGFRDGSLAEYIPELADMLVGVTIDNDVKQIRTLGHEGYDGHPDHIATHLAVEQAVKILRDRGRAVMIFALNSSHSGEQVVTGDASAKLDAMTRHRSQFPVATTALGHEICPLFWNERFKLYHPLFDQETYDLQ